jgi:CopG family nickel-responsive transcriptional regulator
VNDEVKDPAARIVGSITIIYDHHTPDLTRKIDEVEHNYPSEIVSSMHVHLDHHSCLELIAVRGVASRVDELSKCLLGIKGIHYGKLTVAATADRLEA